MWTIYKKQRTNENIKETWDWRYTYQNKLDKACFQYKMTYGYYKDLAWRTFSNKVMHDQALDIASNPQYDTYRKELTLMIYNIFENWYYYTCRCSSYSYTKWSLA